MDIKVATATFIVTDMCALSFPEWTKAGIRHYRIAVLFAWIENCFFFNE